MKIDIPTDWSQDQATAVFRWLNALAEAIWEIYADEIIEGLAEHDRQDQLDIPF